MSTATATTVPFADAAPSDPDTLALIDKLTTEKPLDPETYRRIRERAEAATADIRRRVGEVDIAVDLIRDTRDAE